MPTPTSRTRHTPGTNGRLIIITGPAGTGKAALGRRFAVRDNAVRYNADEWLADLHRTNDDGARHAVEQLQWQQAQQLLRHGLTVTIEWDTRSRSQRDILHDGARRIGAAVELHAITTPADTTGGASGPDSNQEPVTSDELGRYDNHQ